MIIDRDKDISIKPKKHGEIYDMFQQFRSNHEPPGTGAGRATGIKLVERNGGALGVDSEGGHVKAFWSGHKRGDPG